MGTRGMSANFDDPNNSMPSAGGNKLPPIGDEESEMREKSMKKKKKNRSDNTDFWDVLLGLSRSIYSLALLKMALISVLLYKQNGCTNENTEIISVRK